MTDTVVLAVSPSRSRMNDSTAVTIVPLRSTPILMLMMLLSKETHGFVMTRAPSIVPMASFMRVVVVSIALIASFMDWNMLNLLLLLPLCDGGGARGGAVP